MKKSSSSPKPGGAVKLTQEEWAVVAVGGIIAWFMMDSLVRVVLSLAFSSLAGIVISRAATLLKEDCGVKESSLLGIVAGVLTAFYSFDRPTVGGSILVLIGASAYYVFCICRVRNNKSRCPSP